MNFLNTICLVFKLLAVVMLLQASALAEDTSLLNDLNGDKEIKILCFGDSITSGVGDGTGVGDFVERAPSVRGGYPARLANLLGVIVTNAGLNGEVFTEGGLTRLVNILRSSDADTVTIMAGTNDAVFQVNSSAFQRDLQRAINIVHALGKRVVLITLPAPCCNHSGLALFTSTYTAAIRRLAALNAIQLADIERAWKSTCRNLKECELYNLPEGLHPNSRGYKVISQVLAATFLGIDIFEPEGAELLEDALGLEHGTVIVESDIVTIQ
ncbi:MAG: SGNH/GDSL hydrolase family protein [Candidatus Dadabacteria bacterium]|nr:MAG: SGNH/GDSL hydrolase family protein [Candidatus Dadabacteria bacterium]